MTNFARGVLVLSVGGLFVVLVASVPGRAQTVPDAERGRGVFHTKRCDGCHVPGGGGPGPRLEDLRRPQGTLELVGRLWNHVPAMWASVSRQGLGWPDITASEMADLMAYLGADAARDPVPDPRKGQVVLMRKGCLKCHSLRREGGPVQPDLATRRSDYDSPTAWATTMWTHTPRMVRAATAQQVPYPRFAGDEMSNLLGFLRQVATGAPVEPGVSPGR